MSRDTVEQFTPVFNSIKDKLKVSSMMSSSDQVDLCLSLYSICLSSLDELKLLSVF